MPSPIPCDMQLELLPCPPTDANETCTIAVNTFNIYASSYEIWTLYYDKSKTQDGADVGCILMDPEKIKILVV